MSLALTAIMAAVAVPGAVMTATRFPQWRRRRNLRVIVAGLLFSASFALMIPGIYLTFDFGRNNALDLVVKGSLFLALNVVCGDLAVANRAPALASRINGYAGWLLLCGFIATLAVMLSEVGHTDSSPALEAYLAKPVVVWYNTLANAYPAVIGVMLLPHLISTIRDPEGSNRRRQNATIVATGFALSCLGTILLPFLASSTVGYRIDQAINGLAGLCVVLGFVLAYREMGTLGHNQVRRSALKVD